MYPMHVPYGKIDILDQIIKNGLQLHWELSFELLKFEGYIPQEEIQKARSLRMQSPEFVSFT